MDTLLRAAAAGVLVSLFGLVLKKNAPEFALLLGISALLFLCAGAASLFRELRDFLWELTETASISSALLSPLLKCLAVSVTARLSADLCKDAGFSALASAVELLGALTAVLLTLPLLRSVLEMVRSFL